MPYMFLGAAVQLDHNNHGLLISSGTDVTQFFGFSRTKNLVCHPVVYARPKLSHAPPVALIQRAWGTADIGRWTVEEPSWHQKFIMKATMLKGTQSPVQWLHFFGKAVSGVSQDDRLHPTGQEEDHQCAGAGKHKVVVSALPNFGRWLEAAWLSIMVMAWWSLGSLFSRHSNIEKWGPCLRHRWWRWHTRPCQRGWIRRAKRCKSRFKKWKMC